MKCCSKTRRDLARRRRAGNPSRLTPEPPLAAEASTFMKTFNKMDEQIPECYILQLLFWLVGWMVDRSAEAM